MTPQHNAYAAFMLDHAAGRLPPAESLVADLHRELSPAGRDYAGMPERAFADENGVYEKGDPGFPMPNLRRQPRAAGVDPCVCMVATKRGRPIRAPLDLFGIGVGKLEERL